MTRRVIVTSKKILKARMMNWEYHFDLHKKALTFPSNMADRVIAACAKLPEPKITLTGGLNEWEYDSTNIIPFYKRVDILRSSGLRSEDYELLVKWYWTESLWQTLYVSSFNALPYPDPTYEMQFVDAYPQLISISTPAGENWLITADEMRIKEENKKKKSEKTI
jgi:hypothetical protein